MVGFSLVYCAHVVEHAHTNRDFRCLRTDASCPKAIACERLEPLHRWESRRENRAARWDVDILTRHQRRAYLLWSSHSSSGELYSLPFFLVVQLEARVVDDQMQGLTAVLCGRDHLQLLGAVGRTQTGESEVPLTLCETLRRPQWQTETCLRPRQHPACDVYTDEWLTALARRECSRVRLYILIDPHHHIPSPEQPRVVVQPVPSAVHALRLTCLAFVLAASLRPKDENPQNPTRS